MKTTRAACKRSCFRYLIGVGDVTTVSSSVAGAAGGFDLLAVWVRVESLTLVGCHDYIRLCDKDPVGGLDTGDDGRFLARCSQVIAGLFDESDLATALALFEELNKSAHNG